jgi:hypothetical protein
MRMVKWYATLSNTQHSPSSLRVRKSNNSLLIAT